jgi:hypothetical protein
MDHTLNITIDANPVWPVKALETGLGPSPQLETPEMITGRLVDLTVDEILKIKFGNNVRVGFEGGRYRFVTLEKDGSFELRRVVT